MNMTIQASRFKRFISWMIDGIILLSCIGLLALVTVITVAILIATGHENILPKISSQFLSPLWLGISSFVIYLLYFAFFESSKYQATPGKMLMGLYVTTANHGKLTFFRACDRYLVFAVPAILMSGIFYLPYFTKLTITDDVIALISYATGLVLSVIWFLPIYFTKERKCMYDMFSGTRVYAKQITNPKLASRFKRFVAYVVDSIILYVFVSIPLIQVFKKIYNLELHNLTGFDFGLLTRANMMQYQEYLLSSFVSTLIIIMLYFVFFESSKYQATPGKMLLKLYVSTKDDKRLTFVRACLRFWLYEIPTIPFVALIWFVPGLRGPESVEMYLSLIVVGVIYVFTFILYLIWFLPIYFTKERKCMYDMMSGTRVYTKLKAKKIVTTGS